ncbi:hypothetical protein UK23_27135 [Lentzea aerocolonigenes]|uniref:DUF3558 domain-containing protein n=2 Tax=Lentzea aerocolonigenes TaxID=68170 RepID=A0A0F0GNN1_LENAE|nr:hypothetical protein UK23_27135 [Lentzea aerocolonigenes]
MIGMRFAWLLVSVAALTACTSPPEPPLDSPGPKLDPQAIAYDNLDFTLSRKPVFDSTCETLPSNLQSLLGSVKKPATGMGGTCNADMEWGTLTIGLLGPGAGRKSNARHFVDVWNGDRGTAHYFQRSILLDRYYATTAISGEVNESCTVTVDTGSELPFEVRAAMDFDESMALTKQDVDQPIDRALREFCPAARSAAEKLLPLIDENGGSRAR